MVHSSHTPFVTDWWLLTIPFSFPTSLVWSSHLYFLSGYCPICHLLNQFEWQIFTVYSIIYCIYTIQYSTWFSSCIIYSESFYYPALSYLPSTLLMLPPKITSYIHVFSVYFVTLLIYPRFYVARVSNYLLESSCLSVDIILKALWISHSQNLLVITSFGGGGRVS